MSKSSALGILFLLAACSDPRSLQGWPLNESHAGAKDTWITFVAGKDAPVMLQDDAGDIFVASGSDVSRLNSDGMCKEHFQTDLKIRAIDRLPDGNLVLAGKLISDKAGCKSGPLSGFDKMAGACRGAAAVSVVDPHGNQLWSVINSGRHDSAVNSAIVSRQGQILAVGYERAEADSHPQMYITTLSKSGKHDKSALLSKGWLNRIVDTASGVIVAGASFEDYEPGESGDRAWIAALSPDLDILNSITLPPIPEPAEATKNILHFPVVVDVISIGPEGQLLAGGNYVKRFTTYLPDDRRGYLAGDAWFQWLSSDLKVQHSLLKQPGNPNSLLQASDRTVLVAGSIWKKPTFPNSDVALFAMNPDGHVQWKRRYGMRFMDSATEILKADEGAYLVTGKIGHSPYHGLSFVMKTDAAGRIKPAALKLMKERIRMRATYKERLSSCAPE